MRDQHSRQPDAERHDQQKSEADAGPSRRRSGARRGRRGRARCPPTRRAPPGPGARPALRAGDGDDARAHGRVRARDRGRAEAPGVQRLVGGREGRRMPTSPVAMVVARGRAPAERATEASPQEGHAEERDQNPRRGAEPRVQALGHDVARRVERDDPEEIHAHGVGRGHHEAEEERVPGGASRSHRGTRPRRSCRGRARARGRRPGSPRPRARTGPCRARPAARRSARRSVARGAADRARLGRAPRPRWWMGRVLGRRAGRGRQTRTWVVLRPVVARVQPDRAHRVGGRGVRGPVSPAAMRSARRRPPEPSARTRRAPRAPGAG